MKLALAQLSSTEDRDENLQRVLAAIDEAATHRAELIVFPEIVLDRFFPQERGCRTRALAGAESIPGAITQRLAAKAREHSLVIVFNLYEVDVEGRTYDSSPVIDADGTLLGTTRMVHITDYEGFHEQEYYHPGDTGAPVYNTQVGRIGVAICYDRHYPEYMRALGVGGAELVLIPQAGTLGEWPDGLYEAEVRTAAFQNGYFTALCNRVGTEDKLIFSGESFVADPEGRIIARGKRLEDDLVLVDLDLASAADSIARRLFYRDRRPELYGGWLGPRAPVAPIVAKELVCHGDVRVDDYFWLQDRDDPKVRTYLEAENAYTEAMMAPTETLRETLFQEIKERILEDDSSVPYRFDDYYYYSRVEAGRQYTVHCRRQGSMEAPEEILLDVNVLAEAHDFIHVRSLAVSIDQDLLAYAVDTVGRRFYDIRVKNLTTGETLPDKITSMTGTLAWANDNRTLFYARQDPTTLRSYQIYRHVLGTSVTDDVLVYEETEETFVCYVRRTRSKRYLMISSHQTVENEFRFLDANDPTGDFRVVVPRQRGHEYAVDHYGEHFYLRTNDNAKNFRLVRTPVSSPGRENWEEVVAHRDDVYLDDFEVFQGHLVLTERRNALLRLRIRSFTSGEEHEVEFDEPAYTTYTADNFDFDTDVLRFRYTSLATPWSTYDYNMKTQERTLRKRDGVLGGFCHEDYKTERLWAEAADGVAVPISLVYRPDQRREGGNPVLLYGYGSYGASRDPAFSAARISLLDRGFVYALAHVRGGQELGRPWYEDGRLLVKKNTFTDFIACGEHLVTSAWADPKRLYCEGGSAGGLLVGAVMNIRPELFQGVVAKVPFVDVVTTMLDDSLPLTTSEYDEWGDARNRDFYDYMLSYSPYDNVEAKSYPHLLVTTGFHDSQVQYWEPAKWVAKLRRLKTDSNRLLLKTDLGSGHVGPSGRYDRYRDVAFDYAFLLDLAGLAGE